VFQMVTQIRKHIIYFFYTFWLAPSPVSITAQLAAVVSTLST